MTVKSTLPLVLVLLALLGANDAHAICWVERVKRSATGVDIYFMDSRRVTLMRGRQEVGNFQTFSARTTSVYQIPGATVVEAVPAKLGDQLFSSNSSHDSCSMTVTIREGRIGLQASASMQLGPNPPDTAQKFIPAE